MLQVLRPSSVWCSGVRGRDEGEEHYEAEEEEDEEDVDAQGADHDDEGDHAHGDVVEDL